MVVLFATEFEKGLFPKADKNTVVSFISFVERIKKVYKCTYLGFKWYFKRR